ncbi:MAG: type IX secretion system protein PorQ [Bacteroidales bacterium]|nr:type IX secretion system protein PorQ [Bacteroidales bacterium]
MKLWRIMLCAIFFIIQLSFVNSLRAQVAGLNTLSLLQMPSSARTAALGGNYLSVYTPGDIQVGIDNPSLISESYNRKLAVNYVGMFSGSNFASVACGYDFKGLGTFLFGLRYNGYGTFEGYDDTEMPQGDFTASDIALSVAWGLNVDSNFSIGASFMPIRSQYESYTAWAFALNVAGSYVSDSKRFAATIQARNIGAQVATFDGTAESLPFDLSASLSYKADKAPFRLFFTMDKLTRWNLAYDDPLSPENEVDPYTGMPIAKPWYDGLSNVLDEVARHAAVGVEVDIKRVFFVRLGYRYRQNAEMSADDRTNINFSGFSYGFGLRTKKFEFSFARRNYHLGQAPNFLSLSLKL